jgi:hypothetical protein
VRRRETERDQEGQKRAEACISIRRSAQFRWEILPICHNSSLLNQAALPPSDGGFAAASAGRLGSPAPFCLSVNSPLDHGHDQVAEALTPGAKVILERLDGRQGGQSVEFELRLEFHFLPHLGDGQVQVLTDLVP